MRISDWSSDVCSSDLAAAGDGDGELAIQPLRDPKVEDLREKAQRLETQQYYAEAAKTLDQALEIVPDDPALLQERAEAALLLGDPAQAEAPARPPLAPGSPELQTRRWGTSGAVTVGHGGGGKPIKK